MTESWEHFADNEDGEPVFLNDEGQLVDAAGTEYEVESEVPEPEPQPDYYPGHQPSEAEVAAAVAQQVETQRANLEREIDRRLTPAEAHSMADELGGQLGRGEDLDVQAAYVERGVHLDLDNQQDRRTWMAESLKSGEPPARVSRPAADAPAEDHRAYMKSQLNGSPVEGDQ